MKTLVMVGLFAGFALSASLVSAEEGNWHGHKHGEWKSAAVEVCKGQADPADKKACFKQLMEQRKAAMQAFDKSFAYTPTSTASPAPASSPAAAQ